MPTNCVVGGCSKTSKDKTASFFSFPNKDKDKARWHTWCNYVRATRKDFTSPGTSHHKNCKICNAHFREEEFERRNTLCLTPGLSFRRTLISTAVPSRLQRSPKKRRRLSHLRGRSKEVRQIMIEHDTAAEEVIHIPTVENASDVLQRFVAMAKTDHQLVADDILTPCGYTSSLPSNDKTNTTHQGTQVYMKPAKKHYRSKAVNVRSTYWGSNKGMQTDVVKPGTREIATQTTDTENLSMPVISLVVEGESEAGGEDEHHADDIEIQDDDADPDYNSADELQDRIGDDGPRRSTFVSEIESHSEPAMPHVETKYIVFESCLLDLFKVCPLCNGEAVGDINYTKGSLVVIKQRCIHQPNCGLTRKWYSQPFLADIPAGNILISAAILFAGASPKKVLHVLESINVSAIAYSTFMEHQQRYLQPAAVTTWERHQSRMVTQLSESTEKLCIGGDARSDSPGHTAKFGSYTFLELNINKVLHVELVQKNEVENSYNMELEGLKRGIEWIDQMDLELGTIITDRHSQVTAWIREELVKKRGVKHFFDIWHISKGVKKKLRAAANKKDCEVIHQWTKSITNHIYWCASSTPDAEPDIMVGKWLSVTNHIMDIHEHENEHFPSCEHAPLVDEDRPNKAWIQPDSKAADEVVKVLESPYLVRSMKQMSPLHQTSSVEAYHGTINYFAPKLMNYKFAGMLCRLYVANMHFNENAGRPQKRKKDGTLQWTITWPRGRDGEYVLRPVLQAPTYGSIRLVGSDDASHGIVEVFIDGEWGAICDDNIYPESRGDNFAEVVCRQLGHTHGSASKGERGGLAYEGPNYSTMFYDILRCTGSEDRLEDCSYYTKRDTSCPSGKNVASVKCYNYSACTDDDCSIRLVGSNNSFQGIVEVLIDGSWGVVCANNIDDHNSDTLVAEVACRQLGHNTTDGTAAKAEKRGQSAYQIPDYSTLFYVGLECQGSENRLQDCSYTRKYTDTTECINTYVTDGDYGDYERSESAGVVSVKCYNGDWARFSYGGPSKLFYLIVILIFIGIAIFVARRYRQRRLMRKQATTQVEDNANKGTVVPPPTATSHPPPLQGSYPAQPQANQYPAVHYSSVPQGAPAGIQYPPPAGDQYPSPAGAQYPPPDGAQYPPPAGAQYPPPAGFQYPPPVGTQYPPPAGAQYPPPAGTQYPPPAGAQYPPPVGTQYPPPAGAQYPPPAGTQYPSVASAPPQTGVQ